MAKKIEELQQEWLPKLRSVADVKASAAGSASALGSPAAGAASVAASPSALFAHTAGKLSLTDILTDLTRLETKADNEEQKLFFHMLVQVVNHAPELNLQRRNRIAAASAAMRAVLPAVPEELTTVAGEFATDLPPIISLLEQHLHAAPCGQSPPAPGADHP